VGKHKKFVLEVLKQSSASDDVKVVSCLMKNISPNTTDKQHEGGCCFTCLCFEGHDSNISNESDDVVIASLFFMQYRDDGNVCIKFSENLVFPKWVTVFSISFATILA